MEKNNDSAKSLNVIMNVINNPSYFRDTPHRWPDAALPFAYAMACVEVVSQKSENKSRLKKMGEYENKLKEL